MRTAIMLNTPQHQKGIALLMMVLLIVVMTITVLTALMKPVNLKLEREKKTQSALRQAKELLLGGILMQAEYPATVRLRCPDMGGGIPPEGSESGACFAANLTATGRFPWYSLESEPIRDGDGECLWYVVSGNYKKSNALANALVNDDTYGQINLYASADPVPVLLQGATETSRVVAAIIAPGAALPGQVRGKDVLKPAPLCGGNYNPANYLDGFAGFDNAANPGGAGILKNLLDFVQPDDVGNDRVLTITYQDIHVRARKRWQNLENVLKTKLLLPLAQCLVTYANLPGNVDHRLPWPAPLVIAGANLYAGSANYDDAATGDYLGRFPYITDTSNGTLGLPLAAGVVNSSCSVVNPQVPEYYHAWKDHLFYALSAGRAPNNPMPGCTVANCQQVNGVPQSYSAVIIFSGVAKAGQNRSAPPPIGLTTDTDNRAVIGNYLEGANAVNYPDLLGAKNYVSNTDPNVNDILYCVSADLTTVSECP